MLLAGNVLAGSSYVLYCQQEKELAGFTVVLVFSSIFIYIKKLIDLEIFVFRLHDLFLLDAVGWLSRRIPNAMSETRLFV